MAEDRPRKSANKSPPGVPFSGKDDPRNGRGPKKGAPNAGRPRNEFVEWCQQVVSDPKCKSQVEAILRDKKHPAFATMWRAVGERAHGKPVQPISGPDGETPAVLTVRLVKP